MGLKFFYSFLKENGCETLIRIEERISSFKKEHPDKKPIVVFDFKQMISFLVDANNDANQIIESYCGGRERKILNLAEDWFKKLTSLGCKLVFWGEGPLQKDKFPLNKEKNIKKCREIREMFVRDTICGYSLKSIVKIVPIYIDGLVEIAKMYGEVYFSLENENDKDIAYYATKNNALAVVSRDTDMVFFEGSWEIWSSFNVNSSFNSMINKTKIQEHLKLNNLQLSLFAALYQTLTEGKNYSWSVSVAQFRLIASFLSKNIKETKNILNESVINSLISFLQNNQLMLFGRINRDDLIKAIKFYSLEHMNDANYQQLPWLKDHTEECDTALYEILNELELKLNLLFGEISEKFPNNLKNMKLRQIGLVRYSEWIKTNKKFLTTIHVFCKDYTKFTESPIYPLAPVPTVSTILGYEKRKLSIDQKLRFAIWVIFGENESNQWSINSLKDLTNIINKTVFVPKLVLTFLLKNNIFTKNEANILAISLKISERKEHQEFTSCPTILNRRCIQLGYVYIHTIRMISTSLKICGLGQYCKSGYYDGFIFHNIYNKFFKKPENLKQLGDFSDLVF